MNWNDFGVSGPEDLSKDKFTGSLFGESGQLEVLGWKGRKGHSKIYLLKCSNCEKDPELFGEGVFKSYFTTLNSGSLPCGCSKTPKWSREQNEVRIFRECLSRGVKFLGFVEPYNGVHTKIKIETEHGYSESTLMANFMIGQNCVLSRTQGNKDRRTEPEDATLEKFFLTGRFAEGTIFCKGDKKGYWKVKCGECGLISQSKACHMKNGHKPCCNSYRQTGAYILLIKEGDSDLCLKFGISHNPKIRIQHIQQKSSLLIECMGIWKFKNQTDCKEAERSCFDSMDTGVCRKDIMGQGHTETTWLYNFDKIVDIYERYGGVRQ